ncbi:MULTISPECIES: NRAMP family divalent metal transporter [Paracoccus]|uniref:Mn2+/Fe2+ NRAMP family transporter n=1 Tax=Paracoccus versutus TaxID=34007 RepID=A0A3D9XRP9_PARVE|nr:MULTISPECIES: NRAMP family divalent metal transporter [Paracoccus]SFY39627.1 Mn2+ and Fe2+ transporters of the NRAMP family [Paracoccus pantotrophus]MBT0780429.1 divalent metal cation transporter [Paracoccus sp. pheM1]MCJ1901565.1 divalent metal cation transporter [Paracoccus versutus]MDF3905119.1 divalent metal cation transporter [Paracoccus sp. AS002]REF69589.1 Mn2+/Fe2+ NRAMP family transporter [Paracoccus versutus]
MAESVTSPSAASAAARGGFLAAIFLMATSAIGPGFITQTATFTAKLGAAFAFAILASIVIDFVVQLNIWRITALTRRNASDTANAAIPGAGYLLAVLVLVGGLAFNIGNIAGAGLGLNAMFGLEPKIGGALSAALAIGIFLSRRAGLLLDRSLIGLGLLMIAMTVIVALVSNPPVGDAVRQMVLPEIVDFATITTIVGGTVGGYITYSGAHRLLDKGLVGEQNLAAVTRASLTGIAVTGVMRFILFLAILGVVASGVTLDLSGQAANPAAQAFAVVLGEWGMRIFGLIFWAAAITSVIGAAYTSVSFLVAFRTMGDRDRNIATVIFIAISLAVYLSLGTAPAAILVFVGGFNGLILPIGLTIFTYVGFARADLMGGHVYNRPLLIASAVVCALTWYMGFKSIGPIFAFLGA